MKAVIYPANIKTDKEKLFANYSLIQQTIGEYNRQSAIAASNKENYEGKFRTYAYEQFKPRLKQLLAERNRLMEKIRWNSYTLEEWRQISKLPEEEQSAIHLSLFGEKRIEKTKSTKATSPLLDELRAISLDNLPSSQGNDPKEDYTVYTEYDPSSNLTVTTNKIDADGVPRNSTCRVFVDKGSGHFDGDFTHRFKLKVISGTTTSQAAYWCLANTLGAMYPMRLGSADYLGAKNEKGSGSDTHFLEEGDGSSFYYDAGATLSTGTQCYPEIERDEGVGTYGTLYEYICTVNYYGESGSILEDTLTVTLHGSKKDFRYIYGFNGMGISYHGTYPITMDVEDLDLQEAAAALKRSFGFIIG